MGNTGRLVLFTEGLLPDLYALRTIRFELPRIAQHFSACMEQ